MNFEMAIRGRIKEMKDSEEISFCPTIYFCS